MNRKRITHLGYALVLGVLLFTLASCGFTAKTGSSVVEKVDSRKANDAKFYASYRTGDIENSSTYATANIKQETNNILESTRILPLQLVGNNSNSVDLFLSSGLLRSNYLTAHLNDGKIKFEIVPGVVPEYDLALEAAGEFNIRSIPLLVVQAKDWTSFSGVAVEDSSGAQVNKNSDKDLSPVLVNVVDKNNYDPTDTSGHLLLKFNANVIPSNPDLYIKNSNEAAFRTDLYQNDSGLFLIVTPSVADEEAILKLVSVDKRTEVTYVRVKSVGTSGGGGGGGINDTTPTAVNIESAKPLIYVPESRSDSEITLSFTGENLPVGAKVHLAKSSGDLLFQLPSDSIEFDDKGKVALNITAVGGNNFTANKGTTLIASVYDVDGNPVLNGASPVVAITEVRVVKVESTVGTEQNQTLDRSCGVGSYAFAIVTGYKGSDTPSQVLNSISAVSAKDGGSDYTSFKLLDTTISPSSVLACLSASQSNPLVAGSTVGVDGVVTVDGYDVALPHGTIVIDTVVVPPPPAVESVLIATKGVVYIPQSSGGSKLSLTFDGSKLPQGATVKLSKTAGNNLFDMDKDSVSPDSNGDATFELTALSGSSFVSGQKTVFTATVMDSNGQAVVKDGQHVSASTKVRVVKVEPVLNTGQSDTLNKFCGAQKYAFAVVSGYPSDDTNSQIEGSVTGSSATTGSTSYTTVERLDTSTAPATMVACLDGSSLGKGVTVSVSSSVSIDGITVSLPDGTITTPVAPPPPPPPVTATLSADKASLFLPTSEAGNGFDLGFSGTDLPSDSKVKITVVSGDNIFALGTPTLTPGANGKVLFRLTALGASDFTPSRRTVLQAQLIDASNNPILNQGSEVVATTEVRLLKVESLLADATLQKSLSAVCGIDSYAFAQVSGFYPTDTTADIQAAVGSVGATGSGNTYATSMKVDSGQSPNTIIACVNDVAGNKLSLDTKGDATIVGTVSVDGVSVTLPEGKFNVQAPIPVTATLTADKTKIVLPTSEEGKDLTLSFLSAAAPSGSSVKLTRVSGGNLFTFATTPVTPDSAGNAVFTVTAQTGSSFIGATRLQAELVDSNGITILKNGSPVVATVDIQVLAPKSVLADITKQKQLSVVCGIDSYAFAQVSGFASSSSSDMLTMVDSVKATGASSNTYATVAKVDTATNSVVACVEDKGSNRLVLDSNGIATINGEITIGGIPVSLLMGTINLSFYIDTVDTQDVRAGASENLQITIGSKYNSGLHDLRVQVIDSRGVFAETPFLSVTGLDRGDSGPVSLPISINAPKGATATVLIYVVSGSGNDIIETKITTVTVR